MENDLISRKAVLEILMKYCPDDDGSCSEADVDPREMLDEIENLPSVEDGRITIHDDLRIVQGCISLIRQVLCGEDGIFDQLEADEYDFKTFRENYGCNIGYRLNYFEIVQQLLLAGTSHSGGTSTHAKCLELGLDACAYVNFEYEGEEDEHEAD